MSGPARKRALLVGIGVYDGGFSALPGTAADVGGLEGVLGAQGLGAFDEVLCRTDLDADQLKQAIHEFLDASERDELSLVYISGHGMLEPASGEFHFIARDTARLDVARTAVPAGYLNDRLLECRARERVVILDCCHSGGFAVGFRTKGTGDVPAGEDADREIRPLCTKGVVVISSSQALKDSYVGTEPNGPSLFTDQLIQALRTGAADRDRDGRISAMELYEHLGSRLRAVDLKQRQIPVMSAVGVDGPIYLCKAPLTRSRRHTGRADAARQESAAASKSAAASRAPGVAELVGYYRSCVLGESEADEQLVFTRDSPYFASMTGAEQLLSAEGGDEEGLLPVSDEVRLLIERARDRTELVYGYPVVVLHADAQRQHYHEPKLAPLLLRRLELVQTTGQDMRLRPYGEAELNPQFAAMWVGAEEAENLRVSYRPGWTAGDRHSMARDIKTLLRDTFVLECIEELRPESLSSYIEARLAESGARNAAVMIAIRSDVASKMLVDDLESVITKCADPSTLRSTALAPLFGHTVQPLADEPGRVMLSPLNPAQQEVLSSAMSRQLTVATGPPGTGKTALVVSVIATAVGAGQKVLIASTNNRAVDEVWRRCSSAVPGFVVRTGSVSGDTDYREQEQTGLRALLVLTAPTTNVKTWRARHAAALKNYEEALAKLAEHGQAERNLLDAGRARQRARGTLPHGCESVTAHLAHIDDHAIARLNVRASKLSRARLFGSLRRRRWLGSLQLTVPFDPADALEACKAVGALAAAEAGWRRCSRRFDDDTSLSAMLSTAESNVVDASKGLIDAVIRRSAVAAQTPIRELIDALAQRAKDWRARKNALAAVPAWAVSCLSARKFTPDAGLFDLVVIDEASQCSIAAVLPLLMRAKRALVIGDPLQLPPVVKLQPPKEADSRDQHGIDAEWLRAHRAGYREHSAFHALEQAAGGSILLHEHYRCHPQIAGLANELFYTPRDKPLTVLTATSALHRVEPDRAVRWVDVDGHALRRHGSSWTNAAEVARVDDAVRWLLRTLPPSATVGVVTPFAGQATEIQRTWHAEPRVRVGTAHRFQGGECDAVVFSLVASRGISRRGMAFLERNPNLWNVAITRARAHLIIIGDARYWTRAGGLGRGLFELVNRPAPEATSTDAIVPGIEDAAILARLDPGPGGKVDLAVPSAGYVADAVVTVNERRTAILVDGAAPDTVPPDQHLRLQLIRTALLDPHHGHATTLRLPAWRLYDDDWQLTPG